MSGQAAKIAQLLKHGGLVIAFTAPSAGHLVISWYMVPKGAHLTKSKQPVLVATGSVTFHGAGKAKVKIALTARPQAAQGRQARGAHRDGQLYPDWCPQDEHNKTITVRH